MDVTPRHLADLQNRIENTLREHRHVWWQTPPRLDLAAALVMDAVGDQAAEVLADGTMLKGMQVRDGEVVIETEPARELLLVMVASMRQMLDSYGAENYLESEVIAPAPSVSLDLRDGQKPTEAYTVTIQRRTQPTPHEFRQRAEKRLDDVLRIVSGTVTEANDSGGIDLSDLATRLAHAGYPLPNDN